MLKVYGLKVSYFTGKLEAYLWYKEIPYAFHAMTAREFMQDIPELRPARTANAGETGFETFADGGIVRP